MTEDAARSDGLEPQHGGEGTDESRETPEVPGNDAVSSNEMRKLYRELRKWKDRYRELKARGSELEEREKQLEQMRGRLAETHLARVLADAAAAQDAINPKQVAAFLRDRVSLGDDLEPLVTTAGNDSGPETVEELVSGFLSRYPHHRRARLSGGSGSTPSPSAIIGTLKEQIINASSYEELQKIVSQKQP